MVTVAEFDVALRFTAESVVVSCTENSSLFSRIVSFVIEMLTHSSIDPDWKDNGSTEVAKSLEAAT